MKWDMVRNAKKNFPTYLVSFGKVANFALG